MSKLTHPAVHNRALEPLAQTLCGMHLTDGFCSPQGKPDCQCWKIAAAQLVVLESRGIKLTWPFSPRTEHH